MIAPAFQGPLQLRLDWTPPTPQQIATWRCEFAEERIARLIAELEVAHDEQLAATHAWNDVHGIGA